MPWDETPPLHRTITQVSPRRVSSTGRITAMSEEFALSSPACSNYITLPFKEILFPVQKVVRLALLISVFTTHVKFDPAFSYTASLVEQLKSALETPISAPTRVRIGRQDCPRGCCFWGRIYRKIGKRGRVRGAFGKGNEVI